MDNAWIVFWPVAASFFAVVASIFAILAVFFFLPLISQWCETLEYYGDKWFRGE